MEKLRRNKIIISVVMPCLNEKESVGQCIEEAVEGINKVRVSVRVREKMRGEIMVVDNGSTDGSVDEIVRVSVRVREKYQKTIDVRLIKEKEKGYGAALLRGFKEARGEVVIMGDSDGTYDFRELVKLARPILDGDNDMVLGSRLAGKMEKGAMPITHRLIGTPVLTNLTNTLFGLKLTDSQSGYRAVRRSSFNNLGMRMKGMEFASEMLVRAKRMKSTISEVPIVYRKRKGESKLLPMADAWRHVRFLLLFSPGRMFTIPGVMLFTLGLIFFILTAPGPLAVGSRNLDIHTLSVSGMVMLIGFQLMSLGMFSRVYGKFSFGIIENDFVDYFIERFQLEQGIRAGTMLFLLGSGFLGWVVFSWARTGFGALFEMRPVMVGTVSVLLGVQMIFGSFFLSFLRGEGK